MQNDAKLGLLAGVAAVIVIAVVYFPKVGPAANAPSAATLAATPTSPPRVAPASVNRPAKAAKPTLIADDD